MTRYYKAASRWLQIAGDRIFVALVFLTRFATRWVGFDLPAPLFRALAHIPGVRSVAVLVWMRALQRSNRLWRAIDWMEWVCARWPEPRFRAHRVRLLLEARRFDDVVAFLRESKEAIIADYEGRKFFDELVDIETMLAIEKSEVTPESAWFAIGRSGAISDFCYKRAWDAHSAMNGAGVQRYLRYYFRAINYAPRAVFYAIDALMTPNALWRDIVEALDKIAATLDEKETQARPAAAVDLPPRVAPIVAGMAAALKSAFLRRKPDELRLGVARRLALTLIELGDLARARAVAERDLRQSEYYHYIDGLIGEAELGKEASRDAAAASRAVLERAYADPRLSSTMRAELAGKIAVAYEEQRDFRTARQYYLASLQVGGVPYYLPTHLWRHVSMCMAQGAYAEATMVMDRALPRSWIHFRSLAKLPVEKRIRFGRLIPEQGAFLVGCWGIGDDVIRMAMFDALCDRAGGARFGLSCDPRMQGLYARSFDNFEVVPVSRMNGPFAVSELEYFRLRDGLPPRLDRGRLDINVFNAAKRYPEVALTEDFMNAFFRAGPEARRKNRPMLKLLPEKREAARRWLAALPPGLNVGVSWRSGDRNVQRDKSYTDIVRDWGDLLSLKGLNIVNLQYSWDAEELREAQEKHGCVIHMPPFDLKNDIEDILAMGAELDVVLAPCTAVRDMCAAAGANVWALAVTPFLPDLWRLDADGRTDRLFPNMIHVTAHEFGDARGVLSEIARRLDAMARKAA